MGPRKTSPTGRTFSGRRADICGPKVRLSIARSVGRRHSGRERKPPRIAGHRSASPPTLEPTPSSRREQIKNAQTIFPSTNTITATGEADLRPAPPWECNLPGPPIKPGGPGYAETGPWPGVQHHAGPVPIAPPIGPIKAQTNLRNNINTPATSSVRPRTEAIQIPPLPPIFAGQRSASA
jgi:hypothetical protein